MRKSYYHIAMFAALLLAGCAKDNADTSGPKDDGKGVRFTASVAVSYTHLTFSQRMLRMQQTFNTRPTRAKRRRHSPQ